MNFEVTIRNQTLPMNELTVIAFLNSNAMLRMRVSYLSKRDPR